MAQICSRVAALAVATLIVFATPVELAAGSPEYGRRIDLVRRTPGFAALWDFVKRDGGRFAAHTPPGTTHDFSLDAVNYVLPYWNEGREATYDDFPLLGRGPFGQAIRIRPETDRTFRPCLMVPRERMHGSRLDVKGPRGSVSMIVWLLRETGNHAVAGIWHEGTDIKHAAGSDAVRVERGRRQYALFAGLAANNGAAAVHVSENGASSFGDRYARNLAVTKQVIPTIGATASDSEIDRAWSVAGFVFDNDRNTATAWLDGQASDYWMDNPQEHFFFRWPAEGWRQAQLRAIPGLQEGEDGSFPTDQLYTPPERKALSRKVVSRQGGAVVEILEYEYTKVKVTREANGTVVKRELLSIRVNPFWFNHDLYAPPSAADGGPFTIGRVIHSSRNVGFTGYIGGVAVFDRALKPAQMRRLMSIGRSPEAPLRIEDVR